MGSSPKQYVKYKYTYHKNLAWGLTLEKDAGEEFFKGDQNMDLQDF